MRLDLILKYQIFPITHRRYVDIEWIRTCMFSQLKKNVRHALNKLKYWNLHPSLVETKLKKSHNLLIWLHITFDFLWSISDICLIVYIIDEIILFHMILFLLRNSKGKKNTKMMKQMKWHHTLSHTIDCIVFSLSLLIWMKNLNKFAWNDHPN